MNIYNEKLKKLMKERKITQRDIAEKLGIAQPTVNQRLASDKTFDLEDIIKLCDYLEVPLADFLYEEDPGKEIPRSVLSNEEVLLVIGKRNLELSDKISAQGKILKKILEDVEAIRALCSSLDQDGGQLRKRKP